ncbi:hypothetical protein HG535_0E05440 [Zygotorulaspora mrakii]|uniref:Serine/threonine-protein phosphatase n=1 Tax=Zygotorulaspora mrakii TaxID=42260 RepID=A0A7H9B4D4_ZYGMR|nr:uncharacterized protein HG535_0E05440 [Zygotorulaspora mrakii]QLG73460.1 hypothetical protein HG535_0E05440 [Zygotorulaspora mrakii]
MGNSPSKSNNTNFAVPSSSNSQQLTTSEDQNANEPTEPDDSRPLPTIKNNNDETTTNRRDAPTAGSTNTNTITRRTTGKEIPPMRNKEVESGKTYFPHASAIMRPPTSADSELTMIDHISPLKEDKLEFQLDAGIGTIKPFAITNVVNCSGSDSSYSSNESNNSSGSSNNTLYSPSPTKNSITATSATDANYLKPTGARAQSHRQKKQDPAVFLKRYPHDASSAEGIDIDHAIEKLLKIGETRYYKSRDFPFSSWELQLICYQAREIFLNQPSLLKLQAPIKVVGDVHGQFNDLMRILKLSGKPPETNYLFLGDYVDRGKQSLETILLLLCYKIKYRDNFFMLRGNHESANVTKMYGFFDECKRRTSSKTWKMFVDVFNTLPFAAVIQDRIFCVHGGISPELNSLNQLQKIIRPTDIPDEGLITDILWSDPDAQARDWSSNDRGVSFVFGKKNVADFCSKFNFDLVIRGHMVVEDGYEFFAKKKLVTIFSAPNYCGEFNNWGAVMSVTTGLMCSFELLKPRAVTKQTSKSPYSKSNKK